MEAQHLVTFEDGSGRVVRRACNRCYGRSISVEDLSPIWIVSQRGTAHNNIGGEGKTACGIDATGPTWWHRG